MVKSTAAKNLHHTMPSSSSQSSSSLHSRLMDDFAIDWHNKVLLNRIKSAKPKIDTKSMQKHIHPDDRRNRQRTQQQMEIKQKNEQMANKLAEIYARKSRY